MSVMGDIPIVVYLESLPSIDLPQTTYSQDYEIRAAWAELHAADWEVPEGKAGVFT